MMNYEETIEYLYAQLPMFTRIGAAAYKPSLANTIQLCEALGNPQHQFKSIHVAGTNGKGSTCHMLAAIMQTAGYKTGLYTSPHIKHFGERIRVNGAMVSEQFVIDFVAECKHLMEEIKPSFFELTVAMAFAYFAKEKVDIAVIETGMGGLLDSTNVITPEVSVITNIGMDHTHILGNTLAEIASQKAGIIKPGVPVVIGELLPETKNVFTAKANENNVVIFFTQTRFVTDFIEPTGNLLFLNVKDKDSNSTHQLRLDLNGVYQAKNICTVLQTLEVLKNSGWNITQQHLNSALENVKKLTGMIGRWDIMQTHPAVIYDVAHNADGIKQVLAQLSNNYPESRKHFVLGFVKDKDLETILSILPAGALYYFTNAHVPRALPHAELKALAEKHGLQGESFDDVNDALKASKTSAAEEDVIMVCGSFFIISEVD